MNKETLSEPTYISRQVQDARRFYFGRNTATAGNLAVVCGGWERASKDYTINRESFPWFAVEFVAGGKGRLCVRGGSHELRRGIFFAYGPGVRHRIETDPHEVLSKYYLNFFGKEADDLMTAVMMRPGDCRMVRNADELEETFEALIKEGATNRPQAPLIVGLQLKILLLKMAGTAEMDGPSDRRARQTLRRCLAYIDQHFIEIRTVQEVATACHVSASHLTRSFIRFGYGSPHRYLTRRKMVHAAALLDSGILLGREVAERLELDPFQFSRVFKRVHGISPSNFVRRHGVARADS